MRVPTANSLGWGAARGPGIFQKRLACLLEARWWWCWAPTLFHWGSNLLWWSRLQEHSRASKAGCGDHGCLGSPQRSEVNRAGAMPSGSEREGRQAPHLHRVRRQKCWGCFHCELWQAKKGEMRSVKGGPTFHKEAQAWPCLPCTRIWVGGGNRT